MACTIDVWRGMLEFRAEPESPYREKKLAKNKSLILYCASGVVRRWAARCSRIWTATESRTSARSRSASRAVAQSTRGYLVKSKLIHHRNVIFISEAFGSSPPKEADIGDLLDPPVYEDLTREDSAKEFNGILLSVNGKFARIAKWFEDA